MILTATRRSMLPALVAFVAFSPTTHGQAIDEIRAALFATESESHQQWLEGDLAALDELMADEFHFVAMNGAVETKADVIGTEDGRVPAPRPLQIRGLHVVPEQFELGGNVAVVISLMHIDATVRGRSLPPQMRVLSIFTREDDVAPWKLAARSITPLLSPPE